MKQSTTSSIKFMRLKRALGRHKWEVLGILEAIIHFAIANTPAGNLGKYSNGDIAASIEYQDDADFLIKSLAESGWLDPHPEHRFIIHDWADHAPRYVKGNLSRHGKEIVKLVTEQSPKEVAKETAIGDSLGSLPSSLVLPSLVLPSLVLPSLVKEDLAPSPNSPGSEPVPPPLPSQASKPKPEPKPDPANIGEVVLTFPVVGNAECPEFHIRQGFVDEFLADFPGVDVVEQFRAAFRWVKANPERRKTARGMRKFLHGWIERSLSRPGGPQGVGTTGPPRQARETMAERLAKRFAVEGGLK